ncbi:hypothetical protein BB558_000896 [Smittium angustum]|uniref:Uncharacterized protein n=1 Tax=Smittium angustum TaxID=133377 RepID=A0A2U1JCW6_SMIAN|nr:hypothetical protein BB558_000896 [Smittium angustum]
MNKSSGTEGRNPGAPGVVHNTQDDTYCNTANPIPVCAKIAINSDNLEEDSCVYKLHNLYFEHFQTPSGKSKRKRMDSADF